MEVIKSSRHSAITGKFAEYLVLYWLSKYGFECAYIDHIGIDILAKNPVTKELMGISVKSRSRSTGKEYQHLNILKKDFIKIKKACSSFGCNPYFAIVVDELDKIFVFIISLDELLKLFPTGKRVCAWKMTPHYLEIYRKNPEIKIFDFTTETQNWWR